MNTEEILIQILEQLKNSNRNDRLWSAKDIADYLGMALGSVQNRVISKIDFPTSVSIKTDQGSTNRRWYPEEVKDWVKKQRGTGRVGRRRAKH